jgi:hypothetical protein
VFVKAFTGGLEVLANRIRIGPTWALTEFWTDKAKGNREILDKIMQPYLDAEFLKKREGKLEDNEEEGKTLLSSLVQYTDGEALVTASTRKLFTDIHHIDPRMVGDELLNILIAGRDTVSPQITSVAQHQSPHLPIFADVCDPLHVHLCPQSKSRDCEEAP